MFEMMRFRKRVHLLYRIGEFNEPLFRVYDAFQLAIDTTSTCIVIKRRRISWYYGLFRRGFIDYFEESDVLGLVSKIMDKDTLIKESFDLIKIDANVMIYRVNKKRIPEELKRHG